MLGSFRYMHLIGLLAVAVQPRPGIPHKANCHKTGSVPQRRIKIQEQGREHPVLDSAYYELSPNQQSAYLDALDKQANQEKGEILFD